MGRDLCVALVGATGAVGEVFLRVMEERNFPVGELRLTATRRSAGKTIRFRGENVTVRETTPDIFDGADVAFISATTAASKELCPIARDRGAVAFDDSSAWRMEPDVPLVVPELNGERLRDHRGIIATPNCSTVPVVMTLAPLLRAGWRAVRVIADTYQSVSGTGRAAVDELRAQTSATLAGDRGARVPPEVYPKTIAFNVLPHIDAFRDDGYTKEEWKMVVETRKILDLPALPVSATCVRVPTLLAHAVAVHAEFDRPISPDAARAAWRKQPGVAVVDDPARTAYPTPLDSGGRDDVYVGRARTDISHPNGLAWFTVTDNLRKGAATNIIQMVEWMLADGCL